MMSATRVPPRPLATLLAFMVLFLAVQGVRAQLQTKVFASTWGPEFGFEGLVFRYVDGTTWDEISPPLGLADAVWDLEWHEDELWAATMDGPFAERSTAPHGERGRVFHWDGSTWRDASQPGGWRSAVTTVTSVDGELYITVDDEGLFRWQGGTSWFLVGGTRGAGRREGLARVGQAIGSDAHAGRPMLYLAEDNQDVFWTYDPSGVTACGDWLAEPGGQNCSSFEPTRGVVCQADCHGGSCVHALAVHDAGLGETVYAGALAQENGGGPAFTRMYRFNHATRLFDRIDDAPSRSAVQGLASFRGMLMVGDSDGALYSTPDATDGSYRLEWSFGVNSPVSELLSAPKDDLLWVGNGGVPYRWAQPLGFTSVSTWDGSAMLDRGLRGVGEGILALLAVEPELSCDAGPPQSIACTGGEVSVTLDGTASKGPAAPLGMPALTWTWTGDFLEGSVTGATPTVTYEGGCALHVVTLTVASGSVSESCETTVDITDTEPPTVVAALTPRPATVPASPRSALAPRSSCSGPTSGVFLVSCSATDNCDDDIVPAAALLLRRHERDAMGVCVEIIERVAVDCGTEIELRLAADPCAAGSPRSARSAPPARSDGLAVYLAESILLEVTAVDDCGLVGRITIDPTEAPEPPCENPLLDGSCCPALAKPRDP